MGIRRLEADVLSELSRLALDLNDGGTARSCALQAMRLANLLGMGLKQTHTLVTLGLAALREQRRELGLGYLRHARALAAHQEYWLRAREAEQHLLLEGGPIHFEWSSG